MEKQNSRVYNLVLFLCVSVVDLHKIHFSTVRKGKFHDMSYCVPGCHASLQGHRAPVTVACFTVVSPLGQDKATHFLCGLLHPRLSSKDARVAHNVQFAEWSVQSN